MQKCRSKAGESAPHHLSLEKQQEIANALLLHIRDCFLSAFHLAANRGQLSADAKEVLHEDVDTDNIQQFKSRNPICPNAECTLRYTAQKIQNRRRSGTQSQPLDDGCLVNDVPVFWIERGSELLLTNNACDAVPPLQRWLYMNKVSDGYSAKIKPSLFGREPSFGWYRELLPHMQPGQLASNVTRIPEMLFKGRECGLRQNCLVTQGKLKGWIVHCINVIFLTSRHAPNRDALLFPFLVRQSSLKESEIDELRSMSNAIM